MCIRDSSGDQANGALEPLSAMAQRCGAVLAVNAEDYGCLL